MFACFARLLVQDAGQDLIEYGLLCAFVGLSSLAAFDLISGAISDSYAGWDTGINALWQPPNPS